MDKLSVHQGKGTKPAKSKKKPIKVVYISNPMKVKTSASEFRALVQELTGLHSDLTDAAKFSESDSVEGLQTVPNQAMKVTNDHGLVQEVPGIHPYRDSLKSSDSPFESIDDDDDFTSQLLENFTGFFSSNLLYDAPRVDAQKP